MTPLFAPNTYQQLVWDSTSIRWFKSCPRQYYYKMIMGYRKKGGVLALDFGIAYHQGHEWYYQNRAQGQDHDTALKQTVLDLLKTMPETVKVSDDNARTPFTLIRAVVWSLEREDIFTTFTLANGEAAVELSFTYNLGSKIIRGHLDRVATDPNGDFYIIDYKTTKQSLGSYYFNNYALDSQVTLYTIGGQLVLPEPATGVLIDGCQLAVSFARHGRGITRRTPKQIDEWIFDLSLLFEQADACAEKEYWPMNDTSCFFCEFKEVCSKDPKVRGIHLKSDFEVHKWDPTKSR